MYCLNDAAVMVRTLIGPLVDHIDRIRMADQEGFYYLFYFAEDDEVPVTMLRTCTCREVYTREGGWTDES